MPILFKREATFSSFIGRLYNFFLFISFKVYFLKEIAVHKKT